MAANRRSFVGRYAIGLKNCRRAPPARLDSPRTSTSTPPHPSTQQGLARHQIARRLQETVRQALCHPNRSNPFNSELGLVCPSSSSNLAFPTHIRCLTHLSAHEMRIQVRISSYEARGPKPRQMRHTRTAILTLHARSSTSFSSISTLSVTSSRCTSSSCIIATRGCHFRPTTDTQKIGDSSRPANDR